MREALFNSLESQREWRRRRREKRGEIRGGEGERKAEREEGRGKEGEKEKEETYWFRQSRSLARSLAAEVGCSYLPCPPATMAWSLEVHSSSQPSLSYTVPFRYFVVAKS